MNQCHPMSSHINFGEADSIARSFLENPMAMHMPGFHANKKEFHDQLVSELLNLFDMHFGGQPQAMIHNYLNGHIDAQGKSTHRGVIGLLQHLAQKVSSLNQPYAALQALFNRPPFGHGHNPLMHQDAFIRAGNFVRKTLIENGISNDVMMVGKLAGECVKAGVQSDEACYDKLNTLLRAGVDYKEPDPTTHLYELMSTTIDGYLKKNNIKRMPWQINHWIAIILAAVTNHDLIDEVYTLSSVHALYVGGTDGVHLLPPGHKVISGEQPKSAGIRELINRGEAEVRMHSTVDLGPMNDPTTHKEADAVKKVTAASISIDAFLFYRNDEQYYVNREYGVSPQGNPLHGAWVIRNFLTGAYIDHDRYRSDLFERNYISME